MNNSKFTGLSDYAKAQYRLGLVKITSNPYLTVVQGLPNLNTPTILQYTNASDQDGLKEYCFVSVTGESLRFMVKENKLQAFDTNVGIDATTGINAGTDIVLTAAAGTAGGGPESDPLYNSEKGQPLGTPTLDSLGKILPQFLPISGLSNFSPTTAYTAGQTVIEGNKIYQANAAVPAGTFNALQWTEISPSSASTVTTTPTTVTGISTPAQETAFAIGINRNTTTGEVWFKDPSTSTVTKIKDIVAANTVTTDVTVTGTLTPLQETALVVGINRNISTGEVWSKTSDGKVTKLEKLSNAMCITSALTPIAANGNFVYNHALNDANPIIQVIDSLGNVVTSAVNITTTIVDANNVRVSIGSVAGSFKVKVCTGSFTNLTLSGGGGVITETDPNALLKAGLAGGKILGTSATTATSGTPVVATTTLAQLDAGMSDYPIIAGTKTVSTRVTQLESNLTHDVHFGFGIRFLTAGNHFDKSSDELWFYNPVNPGGSANGRYIFLKMDEGSIGATPLIIKVIRKSRGGVDYPTPFHTFTIPANTVVTATSPYEIVNQLGFTPILEGEILYINASDSAPLVGLTIGITYQALY
jgi:hypothetical protein